MPKRLFAVSVMSLISGAVMVGQNLVPACPVPKPTTIAACPLIGCTSRVADALLNQAKNRTDISPTLDDVTVADIKALTQPTDWTTGQPRDSIAATEGWQVRITARLKSVKKEGAESCNCDIGTQVNTDVHLALVDRVADDESESVTAELTPRVRAAGSHSKLACEPADEVSGQARAPHRAGHARHCACAKFPPPARRESDRAGEPSNRLGDSPSHDVRGLRLDDRTLPRGCWLEGGQLVDRPSQKYQ